MSQIKELVYNTAIIGAGPGGLIAAKRLTENSGKTDRTIVIDAGRKDVRRCPILNRTKPCVHCGGSCQIIEGVGGACSSVSCGIFSEWPAGSGRAKFQSESQVQAIEAAILHYLMNVHTFPLTKIEPHIPQSIIQEAGKKGIRVKEYATHEVAGDDLEQLMFAIHLDVLKSGQCDFLLGTPVVDIVRNDDGTFTLTTKKKKIQAKHVVIASGRAGANPMQQIWKKLGIITEGAKGYMGIRYEDRLSPTMVALRHYAADPKFIRESDGTRLFCFCPEGKTVVMDPTSSLNSRQTMQSMEGCVWPGTGWTNYSAQTEMRFDTTEEYREWEREFHILHGALSDGQIIGQSFSSLRDGSTPTRTASSIPNAWRVENINHLLPRNLVDRYVQFLLDFHDIFNDPITSEAHVFAPEAHIWPIATLSNTMESTAENVFVVGDASGHYRGILQAMWAGYVAANAITSK